MSQRYGLANVGIKIKNEYKNYVLSHYFITHLSKYRIYFLDENITLELFLFLHCINKYAQSLSSITVLNYTIIYQNALQGTSFWRHSECKPISLNESLVQCTLNPINGGLSCKRKHNKH